MTTWKEHVKNTGKNMAGKPLSMVLKQASKTWKSIKKTVKASVPNKSMKRAKKVFHVKHSRKHGKKNSSRKKRRKHKGGATKIMNAFNNALGYSSAKDSPDKNSTEESDKVFSSILDEMKELVDSNKCKDMYDIKNVVVLCSENEDIFNGINSILNMQDSKDLYNNIITLAKYSKVKIGQLKKVTDIVKQESCNTSESKFIPDHAEKIKTKIDDVYPDSGTQSNISPSTNQVDNDIDNDMDNSSEDISNDTSNDISNDTSDNVSGSSPDKTSNKSPGILSTVTDGVENLGTSAQSLAKDAANIFTTSENKSNVPENNSVDKLDDTV